MCAAEVTRTVVALVGKIGEMNLQRINVVLSYSWAPDGMHKPWVYFMDVRDNVYNVVVMRIVAERPLCRRNRVRDAAKFTRSSERYTGLVYIYITPGYDFPGWWAHPTIKDFRRWFEPALRRKVREDEQVMYTGMLTLGPKNRVDDAADPADDDCDYY